MSDVLQQLMPFAAALGIEVVADGAGEVRARMAWSPHLCTSDGILHGGAVMALADSAAALCAFRNLPPGAGTTTIESKTNFLRAVRSGHVVAVSKPFHVGRTVIGVGTDVMDEEGRLVARVSQSQLVLTAAP